ncbi:pyruvate, phosphate dikinase [Magnetospira sp. QH-2]|uniref:pyruvate, phosphate dikinase n=1 Tax=Magnetospira sp. (strain QH-2) TaxID=1288970 RepID=UPI0003E81AB3|nr:pyruvate, phosphate dikinase [Magnetospira sp. QH-2]CCQ73644.1 Pyruvate phosphate dikinase [Magnetospira sp. QH-2]
MTKWVYGFGDGNAEGRADMKNLLGGKGANLAEMASLGIPVPAGFTITTELCTYFYENDQTYPADLKEQGAKALSDVEKIMGAKFGDSDNPLLVSVRSGARASMPGMMDTVLNLGLNDDTVKGLIAQSGDERFAYDSYRRFVQMYSDVVLGVEHHHFEEILQDHKDSKGYVLDTDMTADDWKLIVASFRTKVEQQLGRPFPMDPQEQLWGAIGAVFGSWMNQRAITYRKLNDIPAEWGTAVNVQAMVYGNMGEDSATGVCFSRDPSTGMNRFYGEFLINAQGEDVVAGIRTPQPLNLVEKETSHSELPSMEEEMPALYKELNGYRDRLEQHYRDMQDMEFTVQRGKLWMLQTRNGKRTAQAALTIAVEMCEDGLIDKEEAIRRMDPAMLDSLLHPMLDPSADRTVLAKGLPASPGAASGQVVFSADEAEKWAGAGKKVMLVRIETSPEDIGGMHVAQGILTTRGGMTSHAAVVARGMGTPCVSGTGEIKVDYASKSFSVGGTTVNEGDVITIDGASGEVMLGEVPTMQPELTGDFAKLMAWVDKIRTLTVRTNAETPTDAQTARKFGAEGIGLCRTEHMFFDPARIIHMREMIVAEDEETRRAALAKLLPYQRQDFSELFEIMAGLPVTIRLLDPPLHEFLPHSEADMADVASAAGTTVDKIKAASAQLQESNPMLGHRGCRLAITYPEICEMQARAIFEAACEVTKKGGAPVVPEVMVPLVGLFNEFDTLKKVIEGVAKTVMAEQGIELEYLIGTMIELPRAALRAGHIAEQAEFFSFGTNDLTQTAFGLSRDDAGNFLKIYIDKGIIEVDPFVSIDQDGVGELIKLAAERGKATRPDIKLGICGEHGGDPASVVFCHHAGLNYVSCSPYRVPIARLAAAQAVLGAGSYSTK